MDYQESIGIIPSILEKCNIFLEHTPDPQVPVYEGNPFIFVFWGTWGMFQGSVGIFLESMIINLTSLTCIYEKDALKNQASTVPFLE